MKAIISFFSLFLAILVISCGSDKKESQSNIVNTIDEETRFAQTLYGEKASILTKGDLLGDGKSCAIAGIVKLKTENSYWIEKACLFQKSGSDWNVKLKMETKITSPGGELTSQADSKHGYIIRIDSSVKPITINIVMANEYGKGASDDAVIKWNAKKNDFEFTAAIEDNPQ